MIKRHWRSIAPALIMALTGCGSPMGDSASETVAAGTGYKENARAPIEVGGSGIAKPDPVRASTADGSHNGVSLPRATAAPSALFNAAYQRVEDHWEQVLFLCDGVGGDRVKLVTMPNAKGLSILMTYRKSDFRTTSATVRIGDDDPGAGQITRAINRPDGSSLGSIHSINPSMLGDVDDTTLPTLSSITDKNETTRCRWEARGRILLIANTRSVMVTANRDGTYTYDSFDYLRPGKIVATGPGATNVASVTIRGGRLVPADPGHEVYEFRNGPWTYRVRASAANTAPGADLTVLRDGKVIQATVAAAYQMAAKRIE